MSEVVIASRLSDGRVVFLAEDSVAGTVVWVPLLGDATLAEDEARAASLLALGEVDANGRHEVVDPYLIEVVEEGGELRPTKYREAIRCLGPTNRQDHGKQSEGTQA